MNYLLDTSVYCQPLKKQPVLAALRRWAEATDSLCHVSRVCIAEVEYGLRKENNPLRQVRYEAILRPRLHILPLTDGIWDRWSSMKASQEACGRNVADFDLLIAATAVEHELILATLNVRHFALIDGLRCEDWSV